MLFFIGTIFGATLLAFVLITIDWYLMDKEHKRKVARWKRRNVTARRMKKYDYETEHTTYSNLDKYGNVIQGLKPRQRRSAKKPFPVLRMSRQLETERLARCVRINGDWR